MAALPTPEPPDHPLWTPPKKINLRRESKDKHDIELDAMALALRETRVKLWHDLWERAQRAEQLQTENVALRAEIKRLRASGGARRRR